MNTAALLETLDAANRHIAEGEKHIERQREIVAGLERRGRGASDTAKIARELLHSMERVQRAHLSHRHQLKAELDRVTGDEQTPMRSLINASTDAERGSDTRIEFQERS
jgi:hypothetical protein